MPDDLMNINDFPPIGEAPIENKEKKKRKLHGIIFVRNLRQSIKSQFKSVVVRRDDNMANVIEALLRLYIETPECVNKYLPEIRRNRRRSNKKRKR